MGHLFVDADTVGSVAQNVSAKASGAEKAMVAPAYAVGAISEAHSIHKTRRQHDKTTSRRKHREARGTGNVPPPSSRAGPHSLAGAWNGWEGATAP